MRTLSYKKFSGVFFLFGSETLAGSMFRVNIKRTQSLCAFHFLFNIMVAGLSWGCSLSLMGGGT